MFSVKKFSQKNVFVYPAFFILTYITYFLFFKRFGLYEDDYEFVVLPMNASFSGMLDYAKHIMLTFPLGRPLGTIVPYYISYISYNLFGFHGLYIVGAFIVTINVILLYNLLKKRFDLSLAFFGALFFLFFPADTTKGLLIHIYQLQVSLMYSLLACHVYLNRKFVWAFVLASMSLISYESPYLIFLFVPFLFEFNFSKRTIIIFIKHCVVSVIIFVFLFIIRKYFEEPRVGDIESPTLLRNVLLSFITGPLTSIYSFIFVPVKALLNIRESFIIVIPVFIVVALLLFFLRKDFVISNAKIGFGAEEDVKGYHLRLDIPESLKKPLMAVGIGGLMLIGSYLFAFTHYPPKTLIGRGTSVHLAASVAAAILFGGLGQLFIYGMNFFFKKAHYAIIALYIALLAGNGIFIQKDYITSWTNQRYFWKQVLELCPDLNENTNIILARDQLSETEYIYTHSWAVPMVLDNLFVFPESWNYTPKVIILDKPFNKEITERNDSLLTHPRYSFLFENRIDVCLENYNTILLKSENDVLERVYSDLDINGDTLHLKTMGGNPEFKRRELYKYLILDY